MKWNVTEEDLQYVYTSANIEPPSSPYEATGSFFSKYERFIALLKRIDEEATKAEALRRGVLPSDIEPSYLGQMVGEQSKELAGGIVDDIFRKRSENGERELSYAIRLYQIDNKEVNIFCLGASYLGTIYAANGCRSPYVSRSWVEEFIREKENLSPDARERYFNDVADFISSFLGGEWAQLIKFLEPHLTTGAIERIFLWVDAFMAAQEKAEEDEEARKTLEEDDRILGPVYGEALTEIDLEGIG